MKKEILQLDTAKREELSAVDIEHIISSLQQNTSPKKQSLAPEAQAATRLHALTANDQINPQFSLQLKEQIIASAQKTAVPKKEKRRIQWQWILLPVAPLGVTAAALIVAFQWNNNTPASTTTDTLASKKATPLIGASILSEDTDDTQTAEKSPVGYNIDPVEFQRKMNERSTGNLVHAKGIASGAALGITGDDITEEEKEPQTYYADLRTTANSLIAADREIMQLLIDGGMDVGKIKILIENFEKQINEWPTDEEPFNNDLYSKAINDVVNHNEKWNALMKEITTEFNNTTKK